MNHRHLVPVFIDNKVFCAFPYLKKVHATKLVYLSRRRYGADFVHILFLKKLYLLEAQTGFYSLIGKILAGYLSFCLFPSRQHYAWRERERELEELRRCMHDGMPLSVRRMCLFVCNSSLNPAIFLFRKKSYF